MQHRITRDTDNGWMLIEYLGGFAVGKLDRRLMIWDFTIVEPNLTPGLNDPTLATFRVTREAMMDPMGDDMLIHAFLRTRGDIARQRVKS